MRPGISTFIIFTGASKRTLKYLNLPVGEIALRPCIKCRLPHPKDHFIVGREFALNGSMRIKREQIMTYWAIDKNVPSRTYSADGVQNDLFRMPFMIYIPTLILALPNQLKS